jgi:A/G-specific adenine glycosylase
VTPTRKTHFVICVDKQGDVLLEKRPPSGIWGGLWSFPEVQNTEASAIQTSESQVEAVSPVMSWLSEYRLVTTKPPEHQAVHTHTFSHFRLDITPVLCRVETDVPRIADRDRYGWFTIARALTLGLPAPVVKILQSLTV